ncbi:Glycosyltransferase involved in cell wall bisynthesis [Pedobacter westerhofensis]|uniref:Glycosyltransferase involved in cell wall bisynthesis n=1 Tax=Pedobacter westerhofensis TaxID=425512 RepID=A0A521D7T2_9SPHI|nr:glycosyltransferase family 1 protein [Pedobacter westerhofensis]SMO67748.1 Glycosyltransferase involved in cell wall bisynthesis [Pedobacter westerhofensis]
MNIGFDGKRAANNLTGLGNYSRSLILQLSEFFHQNHYYVYSPKVKSAKQISFFLEKDNIHLKLPTGKQPGFWWRSVGVRKQLLEDHIDIYHGLSNEIPFGMHTGKPKIVVTIHDLIFLRLPENYKYIDRTIYNFKSKYACKFADRIIAISEQTKKDIIELYQTDPAKIEVIYQTCDDSFKELLPAPFKEKIRQKYQLPEKYILNVGTIEPRKNLLLIVQALANVPQEYKLVVVGKKQDYAKQVVAETDRLNLTERVIFLKDIPFSDLPAIYQLATVFVYPSFYEGFGIPIIEALYGGIPVIAATGSCLEEAGGPDSLYINPSDAGALAKAINDVVSNPALAAEMKEKGLLYARNFDTQPLARQLMNCYEELVKFK